MSIIHPCLCGQLLLHPHAAMLARLQGLDRLPPDADPAEPLGTPIGAVPFDGLGPGLPGAWGLVGRILGAIIDVELQLQGLAAFRLHARSWQEG